MTNDSLRGIPYVKMRLAQIASGDYKACGHTAEEVASDAFKELVQHTAAPDVERVTQALKNKLFYLGQMGKQSAFLHHDVTDLAKAAIAAMGEVVDRVYCPMHNEYHDRFIPVMGDASNRKTEDSGASSPLSSPANSSEIPLRYSVIVSGEDLNKAIYAVQEAGVDFKVSRQPEPVSVDVYGIVLKTLEDNVSINDGRNNKTIATDIAQRLDTAGFPHVDR